MFRRTLELVLIALRPPVGASAATVRKSGAVTAALGFGVLALAVVLIAFLTGRFESQRTAIQLAFPILFAGFAGIIVGAFRALLATEPAQMSSGKRMTLGVVFGCGALAVFLVLALLVVVAAGL